MRFAGKIFILCVFAIFLISCAKGPAATTAAASDQERIEAQQLVEKSQLTFNNFINDPNMGAMRDLLPGARGIFIVPQQIKGAFIIGAQGGSGVLVQRVGKTNDWTGPAFYTAAGASFGLQAGGQAAEIVLLIMSDRGIAAFMSNSFKLGVDAGIAVGPMGVGAAASTANLSADILSFAKAKGLYGGVALDGAVVAPRDKWNFAYYGKPVKPPEILVKGLKSPQAAGLLQAVAVASRETAQPKAKQAPK
ncbi:MAG: lipid-binding SYLF domain-containing protein [Syntrophaceae bacterium]